MIRDRSRKKEKTLKRKHFKVFIMVDLKGIEPSNLTDANRALSQLSYKPISHMCLHIISQFFEK